MKNSTGIIAGIITTFFITFGVIFVYSNSGKIDYSDLKKVKNSDVVFDYFADKYFNNRHNSWYSGKLNSKIVKVVITDIQSPNKDFYYNGVTKDYGYTIYLNKEILVNGHYYNTESLIENKKFDIIETVLVHEMIHSYMYIYYPTKNFDNHNHGTLYKYIERDLRRKGYKGFIYVD